MTFSLNEAESSVYVETVSKGMLAKLAHDLHIDVKATSVVAEGQASFSAQVRPEDLTVKGVRKSGIVDTSVLSASDLKDIHQKIRTEVFRSPIQVRGEVSLGETPEGDAKRRLPIQLNLELAGKRTSARFDAEFSWEGASVVARGSFPIRLPALGIAPPKGPMGAFRVDDDVTVKFKLRFDVAG